MTTIAQADIARASGRRPATLIAIAIGIIVCVNVLVALSYGGERIVRTTMSLPLIIHLATLIPALPLGAYVLLRRKGDARHRLLGRIWGMLMMTTAAVSFWIGDHLSFLHVLSVVVLVSIPLSVWNIRHGKVAAHRRAMEGVYIGLIIAGAFAFLPGRFLGNLVFG